MANSGYYTEPKLNATGGGGSSLTIREADGTPSGVVTELVFPNTSVAIAGGVGTLSVVPAFNTNVTGGQNSFQAVPPANAAGFASLSFASHSGLGGDNFGSTAILADAESGIGLSTDSGQVQITAGSNEFTITTSGYVISNTSAFRTAISAAAASHTHNASDVTAGTFDDARLSANIPRMLGGLIQASNLPSYVDDVLEFTNLASFPVTGESGKIYVALNTNLTYRWSGSAYVELTDATAIWGQISGTLSNQTDLQTALNAKQNALVSGTSIRTVNGNSLLGSGDLTISGLSAIASQTILGNNTGGSAVPTGLTAAQVRTLLGLATTDSPTFTGVTLGTSGILVGGTNRIDQRNGTNAQIFEIAKTFTSDTVFEELTLDAASDASNYRIGSRIGSAGGTTRGLQLGSYNAAGAWTSWLGLDSNGLAASNLYGTGSPNGGVAIRTTAASSNYVEAIGSSVFVVNTNNITAAINRSSTKSIATTSDGFFAFGPSTTNANGFGAVATLSQSSGTIIASGGFTFTPPASITPATNGQFSIEMTSNTAGNLVYRGSDGTTRRFRFPIGVYSLPLTDGTNNQVLQTNGAGVLSFGSVQKTITSGTAAPSGGADGDIYLQYT